MTVFTEVPALAVASTMTLTFATIFLVILCVLRRKSIPVTRENSEAGHQCDLDPDLAFSKYRQQQQAISLEDLVNIQRSEHSPGATPRSQPPTPPHSPRRDNHLNLLQEAANSSGPTPEQLSVRNSNVVFTSTEQLQNSHNAPARVVNIPGADLIDQFPDDEHVYRLEPTERQSVMINLPPETGHDSSRGDTSGAAQSDATPSVEYAKVNKSPKTGQKTPAAQSDATASVEYAKVNKSPKTGRKMPAAIVTGGIPESIYEKERAVSQWGSEVPNGGCSAVEYNNVGSSLTVPSTHLPVSQWGSEVPNGGISAVEYHNVTSCLPISSRHLSSKSTASNMSDLEDCTEFRREEPAKY